MFKIILFKNFVLKSNCLAITNRKKTEKLISVPNKCPFKEDLLKEAEKLRLELKEEKNQKKLDRKSAAISIQKIDEKRKMKNVETLKDLQNRINLVIFKKKKVNSFRKKQTLFQIILFHQAILLQRILRKQKKTMVKLRFILARCAKLLNKRILLLRFKF